MAFPEDRCSQNSTGGAGTYAAGKVATRGPCEEFPFFGHIRPKLFLVSYMLTIILKNYSILKSAIQVGARSNSVSPDCTVIKCPNARTLCRGNVAPVRPKWLSVAHRSHSQNFFCGPNFSFVHQNRTGRLEVLLKKFGPCTLQTGNVQDGFFCGQPLKNHPGCCQSEMYMGLASQTAKMARAGEVPARAALRVLHLCGGAFGCLKASAWELSREEAATNVV